MLTNRFSDALYASLMRCDVVKAIAIFLVRMLFHIFSFHCGVVWLSTCNTNWEGRLALNSTIGKKENPNPPDAFSEG